jgi:hypothetical protein
MSKNRYVVSNGKTWIGEVEAERIEKDTFGSTLFFNGEELIASFPLEYWVSKDIMGGKVPAGKEKVRTDD